MYRHNVCIVVDYAVTDGKLFYFRKIKNAAIKERKKIDYAVEYVDVDVIDHADTVLTLLFTT